MLWLATLPKSCQNQLSPLKGIATPLGHQHQEIVSRQCPELQSQLSSDQV